MKKYQEIALWYALREKSRERASTGYPSPGVEGFLEVIDELEMDQDQAHYYLNKWASKGLWDSGVTVRGGWFTPKGQEVRPTRHGGFVEK